MNFGLTGITVVHQEALSNGDGNGPHKSRLKSHQEQTAGMDTFYGAKRSQDLVKMALSRGIQTGYPLSPGRPEDWDL